MAIKYRNVSPFHVGVGIDDHHAPASIESRRIANIFAQGHIRNEILTDSPSLHNMGNIGVGRVHIPPCVAWVENIITCGGNGRVSTPSFF